MENKYTVKEVKAIVDNEGLAYSIQNYMAGSSIQYQPLAILWDEAQVILDKIDKILDGDI